MQLPLWLWLGRAGAGEPTGAPPTSGFGFVVIADREDDEAFVSVLGESDEAVIVMGDDG